MEATRAHVEVRVSKREGAGTGFRKPTPEELREAAERRVRVISLHELIAKAQAALAFEEGQCKHAVFYDEPGYIYDVRLCYGCDRGLGLI